MTPRLIRLVVLGAALLSPAAATAQTIRVFVSAAPLDPSKLADSVRDLQQEIGKRPALAVAATAASADAVVQVVSRSYDRKLNVYILTAELSVDGVPTLLFTNCVSWGSCAKDMAGKLAQSAPVPVRTVAYRRCAVARTDEHARGAGTPTEIAEAVLGDCGPQYTALEQAIRDYFLSVLSTDATVRSAAWSADDRARDIREDVRRSVISRVLRLRDGSLP